MEEVTSKGSMKFFIVVTKIFGLECKSWPRSSCHFLITNLSFVLHSTKKVGIKSIAAPATIILSIKKYYNLT